MSDDFVNYDRLVEEALRGVVREALRRAEREGLVGGHHFYISFRTSHPDVELADDLRAEHGPEMTIVLQNQFWGLEVDDEAFAVTLNFHGASQRLRVPFPAVTAFADPSVEFGLQFKAPGAADSAPQNAAQQAAEAGEQERVSGAVVTLDAFRGKK